MCVCYYRSSFMKTYECIVFVFMTSQHHLVLTKGGSLKIIGAADNRHGSVEVRGRERYNHSLVTGHQSADQTDQYRQETQGWWKPQRAPETPLIFIREPIVFLLESRAIFWLLFIICLYPLTYLSSFIFTHPLRRLNDILRCSIWQDNAFFLSNSLRMP